MGGEIVFVEVSIGEGGPVAKWNLKAVRIDDENIHLQCPDRVCARGANGRLERGVGENIDTLRNEVIPGGGGGTHHFRGKTVAQ